MGVRAAKRCRLPRLLMPTAVIAFRSPPWAQASFVSASPVAAGGLPEGPGAVATRFGEALNIDLSRVDVVDRFGREVSVGASEAAPGDAFALHGKLGFLSSVDGHSLHGSYRFASGARADPGQHTQPIRAAPQGRSA
jgi:methionine-rich copper-binding protein CopC